VLLNLQIQDDLIYLLSNTMDFANHRTKFAQEIRANMSSFSFAIYPAVAGSVLFDMQHN